MRVPANSMRRNSDAPLAVQRAAGKSKAILRRDAPSAEIALERIYKNLDHCQANALQNVLFDEYIAKMKAGDVSMIEPASYDSASEVANSVYAQALPQHIS